MSARSTDCVHVTVDSAVAAPQATFGGESVFRDVVEVAAAYLFYLCRNHPFLDGDKRAALGACIVFLRLNRRDTAADSRAWETLTLEVAGGSLDRHKATTRLRRLVGRQT